MREMEKKRPLTLQFRKIVPEHPYHFFFSRQYVGPKQTGFWKHDHDYFEFFLVESGTVIHTINGMQELLVPGDLRFILPDDVHRLQREKDKEFAVYNCNIDAELFQTCFRFLTAGRLAADDFRHRLHLSGSAFEDLLSQLKSFVLSWKSFTPFQVRLAGRAMIVRVLELFLKHQDTPGFRPVWLEELCMQMQRPENFCHGVRRLFELTDYSQEHVSRSIRKYLGITPRQLILEYKMQNVVRELIHTDQSVNRIALQNGFRNYAYFHKSFLARYECTPLHFRKNFSGDTVKQSAKSLRKAFPGKKPLQPC